MRTAGLRGGAYLGTRAALMATRLLSRSDLESLARRSAGQTEAALDAGVRPFLGVGIGPASHPLEQRLLTVLLGEVVILSRGVTGRERDFVIHWMHRAELANLKAILRGKMVNEAAESIRANLVEMGPFAGLPVDDLLRTEGVPELLARLERSPYADIARQARRVFEEQRDLFALDTTIDRRYYVGLVRRAAAIEAGTGPDFRALMASVVDHLNLLWLLRYRFFYELPPSQVWYLLVASPYRLSSQVLQQLVRAERFEEVAPALPQPYRQWLAQAADANSVARILASKGVELARRLVRLSPSPLARAFAYLLLREHDLRNLHALLKGQQLGVDQDTVLRALDIGPLLATATAAAGRA
jgi:V/A-type H+/Na+-transporting ATPase subunit C